MEKTASATQPLRVPDLYIVALDDASRRWAFVRAQELRRHGRCVEIDYLQRSIKAQMREANRQKASYVLVVGETELQSGSARLKNMADGSETTVTLASFDLPTTR